MYTFDTHEGSAVPVVVVVADDVVDNETEVLEDVEEGGTGLVDDPGEVGSRSVDGEGDERVDEDGESVEDGDDGVRVGETMDI